MAYSDSPLEDILTEMNVDIQQGLSQSDADEQISTHGLNVFEEGKKETLFEKILHHLKDVSTIILLIATGISAYIAITTGDGWAKVFVILSIIIINIVLGVSQESRAEKALDALKGMNAHQCTVIRDGTLMHLDASELVPGDVVELHAGDIVPADARLIQANSLQKVVVCATGMKTEMGKIAALLNNTKKQLTPLQARLQGLAKRLSLVAVAAGVIIFGVGVFLYHESLPDMLLTGISLAVAAVPETLPVIVTLILANGVQQMVKKNTIIRRMPAVETVGNTSVICSDKTGTLTQNKMVIQRIWRAGHEPNNSGHTFAPAEQTMLELLVACTNAVPKEGETQHGEESAIIGDPTEAAIVRLLLDKGFDKPYIEKEYPRVFELPFDSTRKLMTTVHKIPTGYISVTKGAFDRIPVNFDENALAQATKIHDDFAGRALRVIAVAVKEWDELPADMNAGTLESELDFMGLVGMIDPPRPESRRAVRQAKEAGISTVMITGDHVGTASAIAKEIGILNEVGRAITGSELSHMGERELHEQIRDISVYARVSPEDKIRIVQAWQAHGEVITMTGDGVNDAPALKAADVGAAMGIAGTDVSKNASDIIITDDNFATIVDAVNEGRTAYDNIRKTVHFLLSVNFAQIFIMLIGVLLGWGAPLSSVQLLFINVVSDGIPGFFISREKAEKDLMQRKPLPKNSSLFAAGLGGKIAIKAFLFTALTLCAFFIGRFVTVAANVPASYETGITMAFLVLSWASVLNIFNVRSTESVFKAGFTSNPLLTTSAVVSILISALVTIIAPLRGVFGLSYISPTHWLIAIGLALLILVVGELLRLLGRKSL